MNPNEFPYWYSLCVAVAVIKGLEAYVRTGPGGGLLMAVADALTAVVVFVCLSAILIGLWSGAVVMGHKLTDMVLYAVSVLVALIGLRQVMALWNKRVGLVDE